MRATRRILLISGSLRSGSTNGALLRTARAGALAGIEAVLYEGLGTLPHFNPDDDPDGGQVHAAVADLRAQLAAADALLICTPEYAGALPGSLKNLLLDRRRGPDLRHAGRLGQCLRAGLADWGSRRARFTAPRPDLYRVGHRRIGLRAHPCRPR